MSSTQLRILQVAQRQRALLAPQLQLLQAVPSDRMVLVSRERLRRSAKKVEFAPVSVRIADCRPVAATSGH